MSLEQPGPRSLRPFQSPAERGGRRGCMFLSSKGLAGTRPPPSPPRLGPGVGEQGPLGTSLTFLSSARFPGRCVQPSAPHGLYSPPSEGLRVY